MEANFFDDKKINLIIKHTCSYFGLNPVKVFSLSRTHDNKTARQIIHYLSKKHTKKSLESIGNVSLNYGRPRKHDHASVMHSIKSVNNNLETDAKYLRDVQAIEYKFKKEISELTPDDLQELSAMEINHKLQDTILEKNNEIKSLTDSIENIKSNIIYNTDNVYLRQLLVMDREDIDNFCETRLKPFLKMQESKITNDDLIRKQKESRDLKHVKIT